MYVPFVSYVRSFTALWKLPLALMFRPRNVSFFLCAVGQRCLDGICICGPGDWTFFGTPLCFVLLRFTVRARVWQNLCKRSRCCCRPSLVDDRSTRSSANSSDLTSDYSRMRPGAADCSSARARSLIHTLPFKSLGSLRNVLIFERKAHFLSILK
jgi:hypothetical protein